MKITLLFPENPNKGGFPLAPPILEYLAALTRMHLPDCELELIDANRRKITPADIQTDLLGISLMTPSAPWGYRFADACRARGVQVVLGGIHPSVLPDEAKIHADAVGEGDSVVIVDDVLATGGTAAATIRLVESLGAKVAGLVFLIELPALGGRSLIEGYEINSVLQF